MDDIIKIAKSLETSSILTDGAAEKVQQEIRRQEGWFLGAMMALMVASFIAPMASLLIQPVVSSLINAISGKRVMRAKKNTRLESYFISITFNDESYVWKKNHKGRKST